MVTACERDEGGVRDQYSPADSSAGKLFCGNQVVDAAHAQPYEGCSFTFGHEDRLCKGLLLAAFDMTDCVVHSRILRQAVEWCRARGQVYFRRRLRSASVKRRRSFSEITLPGTIGVMCDCTQSRQFEDNQSPKSGLPFGQERT